MDFQDDAGRRYVRYEYETLDCSGAVKDGTSLDEICRGKILPRRRHVTVATVGFELFTPDMPGINFRNKKLSTLGPSWGY